MRRETPSWRLEQWIKKLKCSGCTGTELESFSDIRVGVDPAPVSADAFSWKDEEDSSDFYRFSPSDLVEVAGKTEAGKLTGRVKLRFKDGRLVIGYFKEDVLHGFARYFDSAGRLMLAGQCRDGRPVGTWWSLRQGGGCLVGEVDLEGRLTGPEIAYIYPDHLTALLGEFSDGQLVAGQEGWLVGLEENQLGVKVPTFQRSHTGDLPHLHRRQIGRYNFICDAPDPYESRYVAVRQSMIEGASEGLFARADIEPGTTVAFYNGSRANPDLFDPSSWETNNYRIYDPADIPHGTIDIPDWAQSTTQYRGSLAHKCNHSFTPNAQFVVFDHPKFGLIPSVSSTADISEGEEITVGYGYDIKLAPDWYKKDWEKSIYGQQGMDYQDWLDCTIKHPLALN